jgi:hypothetical protein
MSKSGLHFVPPNASHTRQVTVTSSIPAQASAKSYHQTIEEKSYLTDLHPHTQRDRFRPDEEMQIQLFSLKKILPSGPANTIEKIKVYRPQTASQAAMKKKLITKQKKPLGPSNYGLSNKASVLTSASTVSA